MKTQPIRRTISSTAGRAALITCILALVSLFAAALVLAKRSRNSDRSATNPISYAEPGGQPGAQSGDHTGEWLAEFWPQQNMLYFTLRYQWHEYSNSSTSSMMKLDQLQGLATDQINSGGGTNVSFKLVRDAGTFGCEGWFKGGNGSGHFNYTASSSFQSELKRRGIGEITEDQQFRLALEGVGVDLLNELEDQGYGRPTAEQLVKLGEHGVRLDYLRGLKDLGFRLKSIDAVIKMRDHGVSLDFIRGMRSLGFNDIQAEDLVRIRDHGVTPEYVNEMKQSGFDHLSLDQLVSTRDHGVTSSYIHDMAEAGLSGHGLEDMVRARDHGVT
ncbi:MAG: hypothetical protein ACREAC_04080, partial [Blastocatellia bacterium]